MVSCTDVSVCYWNLLVAVFWFVSCGAGMGLDSCFKFWVNEIRLWGLC